ncbi:60S ribosomal protein L31 [archaeon]|nr:60S ribosomal protein L31 [archaeon]
MERVFVIPLREVKKTPRSKRVQKAVKFIRGYISKHMKTEDVKLSDALNKKIWEQGMRNIPSKIEVKASVGEDGGVLVTPVE